MKKGIIALICMVLTLVFIIVALVGPWYGGHGEASMMGMDIKMDISFGLTEGGMEYETSFGGETEKETNTTKYDENFEAKYVFDNTMYIAIGALITAIIALIAILGMTFNFGNPKTMKKIGGIFSILTVLLALVAVVYFMTALPSEFSKDYEGDVSFWDEIETSEMLMNMKYTVGPGYAWYLMLVSFIFALIVSIVVFMEKLSTSMATISPQQPQQPQQPKPPR